MLVTITDTAGEQLNSKVEIAAGTITVHSRGGAFGKPNLRNPDYRQALRLILSRLQESSHTLSGVWLDSSVARTWPESDRLLIGPSESTQPVDDLVTKIGQRGAAKGRPTGSAGHGNSTKRVRIGVPGASISQLLEVLGAEASERSSRLPAATLWLVQSSMIDEAIEEFRAGVAHHFGESTDYDLLLPTGERLPPKAIFGIALSNVIGRPAVPADFSAGWGQPCFAVIEEAGYPIVPKGEVILAHSSEMDDERVWAEGFPKRVSHLRKERSPALAKAKKRRFREEHGHLFCERCGLIPSDSLGEFGDACIEVHHQKVAVAMMDGPTHSRLSDLQCLCANCHRIIHREKL